VHNRYHAIFVELEGGGYAGYVEEIPGANTQADTLEDARVRLREAIRLVNEANRQVLHTRLPLRRLIHEEIDVEV